MATEKQKAASRATGARSRGPVTPQGRLRSAGYNVERGLLARTVVLDRESLPRFHALMTSLQEELKPETAIENLLIHKMAVSHWRLMRVWGRERSGFSNEVGPPESHDTATGDTPAFGKSGTHLNQYEMRLDRQFTRALDRFEKFRATRTRHVQQTTAPEVPQ
jgi:hypothetical protein